jgi:hypothetical protein
LDEEKMNKEFKKISGKSETRYILEDASAGGTSAGAIASVPNTLGTLQKRLEELKKSVTVPKKSPRNPVGMGATPGRGTQKHVRSNRKSEKDNKKVFEKEEKQVVKLKKISPYPFATRDVAILGPSTEKEIYDLIVKIGGENLVRATLFDVFTKEGKTSYAFRLVFQSATETLKDDVIDSVMKKVGEAVAGKGWIVR